MNNLSGPSLQNLPLSAWKRIAGHLEEPKDFFAFGSSCKAAKSLVDSTFKSKHFDTFRKLKQYMVSEHPWCKELGWAFSAEKYYISFNEFMERYNKHCPEKDRFREKSTPRQEAESLKAFHNRPVHEQCTEIAQELVKLVRQEKNLDSNTEQYYKWMIPPKFLEDFPELVGFANPAGCLLLIDLKNMIGQARGLLTLQQAFARGIQEYVNDGSIQTQEPQDQKKK